MLQRLQHGEIPTDDGNLLIKIRYIANCGVPLSNDEFELTGEWEEEYNEHFRELVRVYLTKGELAIKLRQERELEEAKQDWMDQHFYEDEYYGHFPASSHTKTDEQSSSNDSIDPYYRPVP
jgi:hypothetical protein